ncbi:MAG: amidohydrolase family protein [Actinobacteria bacterium]|nr:amidohydrolase family protein [Actinomycetota bacterium]
MYSDRLLLPWYSALMDVLPGVELFDAHTHTGFDDPDGVTCSAAQLLEGLEIAGARAVVFTTQDPGGYRAANDRVIEEAAASDGRLVPFCRLNPADDPVREAERALARGARGIKLHPRAEQFRLADERLGGVYALADERRLPIITHAGRGIPALGRDALEITSRHPGLRLILAHAGVSDLSWIWRHAADHPNLFFDTAWWSAPDLLTLFTHVPPGQILFASDMPYGTTTMAAIIGLRSALQAGLSVDQIREVAAGQVIRLLEGEDPVDLGPAPGEAPTGRDLILSRIHAYLSTATGRMMLGDDVPDYVGLARLACEVGDDAPQAGVCASVLSILDRAAAYPAEAEEPTRPPGDRTRPRPHPSVGLTIVGAALALTPDVPVPVPERVAVAERSV